MRIVKIIRRSAESDSGNVAILFAILLPVIIGLCGIGVEVGYGYFKNRQLQSAADIAAFSGAVALYSDSRNADVAQVALLSASANGFDASAGTIVVRNPPTSGNFQNANSVEVELTFSTPRVFSAIFNPEPMFTRVRAVATTSPERNTACILALNPTASSAVSIGGNTNIASNDCNVAANSRSNSALRMTGSSRLTTPCVLAVGGVSVNSGLTLTLCDAPMTNMEAVSDPYADVAAPPVTGGCMTVASGATILSPGRYCGGIDIKGAVTFLPGVYTVDGGTFSIGAQANAVGTNVTFYFHGNSAVSISANSQYNLTAPETGPYSGLLFFGDRNATSGSHTVNGGTSSSNLTGALYFPTRPISYSGGSVQGGGCTQIIADSISFSGNSRFTSSCPNTGIKPIKTVGAAGATRLVE
jgi:hypothetical protein